MSVAHMNERMPVKRLRRILKLIGMSLGVLLSPISGAFADFTGSDEVALSVRANTGPPGPVTDLAAASSLEEQVDLAWTAIDENEVFPTGHGVASYIVRRATYSVDSLLGDTTAWWNAAQTVITFGPGQTPGSAETVVAGGLEPGNTYYFAVKSLDQVYISLIDTRAATSGQQARAAIFDTAPPAPTSLTAVPGSNQVTLAWDAVSIADLWYYRIYVDSTTPYDFGDQFLISVASASTSYTHTGLTPGSVYSYFVTAVDKGEPDYPGYALESPSSNVVSTMTNPAPPVPTGLTASGVFASSMTVSWNASAGAVSYTLKASTAGDFSGALNIPTVNTFAVLEGLFVDTTYYFHVNASNALGSSAFSSPISTPTLANAPAPRAFDGVTTSGFRANWLPNGNPAWTGYRIEISSDMNFAFLMQAADVSGSSAAFVSLAPDTTYYARARAVNVAQTPTVWVKLGGVVTANGVLAVSADKLINIWYATLPAGFNAQGADHYHYKIASTASDLPSTTDPSFTGAPLNLTWSEGIWYFNIRGEDLMHNQVGNASYGPLKIDATPPALAELRAQRSATDTTPILSGVPSDALTPRFAWDAPASLAPILGYSYTISIDPAAEPVETVNTTLNFLDYIVPSAGTYYVKVKAQDSAGNWSPWVPFSYIFQDIPSQTSVIPENNYFNPRLAQQMTVRCDIHQPGRVRIRLFTLRGELVKTLVDEQKQPGRYAIPWGGLNKSEEMVATGVYLLYVEAPGYKRTFKCIVAK